MSTYKILTEDVRENILNRPEVKELQQRIKNCCGIRDSIAAGLWAPCSGVAKLFPGTGDYMHAENCMEARSAQTSSLRNSSLA